jgi:probable HAF family extracellular repeat protein
MRKWKSLAALGFVLVLASVWAQAQSYHVKNIGTLGGTYSQGLAINDSGWVIGYAFNSNQQYTAFIWNGSSMTDLGSLGGFRSELPSPYFSKINASGKVTGYSYLADSTYHAFRWDGSMVRDLGTLGGRYSQGNAINAAGLVAGYSYLADETTLHAFVTKGASLQDLGTLGGADSSGSAINDTGQVTGYARLADSSYHAFLWNGTRMQDLGTLGGAFPYSDGRAINASGQVAGITTTPANELHVFLWDGSTMQDLGFLGGTNIEPMAINASGQVAGRGALAGASAPWHAFFSNGAAMQDLGTLGGANSYVSALNDSGQVVGQSDIDGTAVTHAFLWDGISMRDLNDLIDPADPSKPFVTLNEATGINELGQIVANGCDTRYSPLQCFAYVVSPGSTIASLSLNKSTTAGCLSVIGTVTLSAPASAAGTVVSISDTLTAATTPLTVTVPAGATSKTFSVKTVPVAVAESGVVRATVGGTTLSQNLTVRPMGLRSITLTPTSAVGGNQVTGKATLECKAAPGAILVDLSSGNAAVATPVAAGVAVLQGLQSVSFDVTTRAVQAKSYATIAGTANGITKSKKLTVNVAAAVSPTRLGFGSVPVNTTSGPLNATLTNKGATAISVSSIGLTGTNAKYYAQTNNCPSNLAAGASCTVAVTFKPTVTGSKSATLSIATSATSTPLKVALSGTGI